LIFATAHGSLVVDGQEGFSFLMKP